LYTLSENRLATFGFIIALCAVVLVVDLQVSLGVAGGVPYLLPVLVTLWMPGNRITLGIAVVCSGLTLVGLYYSPVGGVIWQVLFNRGLALFVIWISAWFILNRKNTESELARKTTQLVGETEEKYFKIFNSSPDSIAISTLDEGRIIDVNDGFERLNGFSREEAIGRTPQELSLWVKQEERENFKKILKEQGRVHKFEVSVRIHSGEIRTHQVSCEIINIDGEPCIISFGKDVTEQNQIETKLRDSETQLLDAQRMGHMGNWHWDIPNDTVHWSSEIYRIYGLSRDDEPILTRERIMEAVHPDDRDRIYKNIDQTVESGEGNNNEYRLIRPDGSVRTVSSRREVLHDEDGNVIGLAGTVHDITESKQAEEALRNSEERFDLAIKGSNDGIWDWDIENDKLWWSPHCYDLLGYQESEIEPTYQHYLVMLHPEDKNKVQEAVQAHFDKQIPFDMEFRLQSKSGKYKWFRGRGQALWNKKGKPVRMSGSNQDISVQKEAEEGLRLQSEIALNLAEGILLIRMDDGKIIYNNPRFEEMFGYNPDELLEKHVSILNAPSDQDPEETASEIMDVLHKTGGWHGEVNNIKKDGTPFWCYANASLFNHHQYGKVLVSAHIDITERKQMEVALQQHQAQLEETVQARTAELSNANEELRAIAHTIAHDLKAPLRAVAGFSELLGDGYAQSLDTTAHTYLDRICGGAQRMSGMLDDLLQHATLGEQKEMVSVDMAAVWTSVLQDLDGDIRSSGAEIMLDGKLPMLLGHRPTLEVLLRNLLSNALKFAAPGVTPRIKLTVSETTVGWTLSLADNGIGMASKHLDSIFELFYKLHTREQYPGTGIGLALVRKAVQIHGGSIEVETSPGSGTTFHIALN
jgi:PAS domain S-box-containing protein